MQRIYDLDVSQDLYNKLILAVNGEDFIISLKDANLTMDCTDDEVISSMAPMIQEVFDVDISKYYRIIRSYQSRNIYIIPSSVAG